MLHARMGEDPLYVVEGRVDSEHVCDGFPPMTSIT